MSRFLSPFLLEFFLLPALIFGWGGWEIWKLRRERRQLEKPPRHPEG
jgi:hypothetical protein